MLNGLPRNWLGEPGIQASAKLSALLARRNILLHNVVGNMRQFIGTPPCSILPYSRWLRSSESGSGGGAWPRRKCGHGSSLNVVCPLSICGVKVCWDATSRWGEVERCLGARARRTGRSWQLLELPARAAMPSKIVRFLLPIGGITHGSRSPANIRDRACSAGFPGAATLTC